MADSTYGGTIGSTTDSGTKAVDNNGDNGWLNDLLSNAGSILIGGAQVINAINGKTPVTNVYQSPSTTTTSMMGSNIWLYILIALVIIVVLFLVLKK